MGKSPLGKVRVGGGNRQNGINIPMKTCFEVAISAGNPEGASIFTAEWSAPLVTRETFVIDFRPVSLT
jgi:hypothetical protein